MMNDPKFRELRKALYDAHMLLETSDASEPRYTFMFASGPLVIARHPRQVKKFAVIVCKACGKKERSLYLELCSLRALRDQLLEETSRPSDIVWKTANAEGNLIRFDDWFKDQHLMDLAHLNGSSIRSFSL